MLPPGILSHNRARVTNHYALLPAIGIVDSVLPNFKNTIAHVQAAPALGRVTFVQMLLDMAPEAGTRAPIADGLEHFFYVRDGAIEVQLEGQPHTLTEGGYAYLPPGQPFNLVNTSGAMCHLVWIKRHYVPIDRSAPPPLFGNQHDVPCAADEVAGACTQRLLPFEDTSFDMAVNILRFEPGVYFDSVETHIMEHGLYMLAGQGIYYLTGDLLEVQATDFIWMAPYCPQFFFCTGWEDGAYLLYKDVNRDISL